MSTTFFFSSTMRWRKYSVFFLRTPKFDRVLPSLGTYVMSLFMSFPLSERIFRLRLDWTSSSSVQNVRLISGAQTVCCTICSRPFPSQEVNPCQTLCGCSKCPYQTRHGICYRLYRFLNKSEGTSYDFHDDIYYKSPIIRR